MYIRNQVLLIPETTHNNTIQTDAKGWSSYHTTCLPTFFDRNGWFLLPQAKKDEEEDQWDEDLKGQHPLVTEREERPVTE